ELTRQREIDMRDLYAFSRRLAGAFDVSDIHAAIQDHLATVLQRNVILFAGAREAVSGSASKSAASGAQKVREAVSAVAAGRHATPSGAVVTAETGEAWLVRAVSPKNSEFGVTAINLGRQSQDGFNELRIRLDAVLADATATLERLDVAHAINE